MIQQNYRTSLAIRYEGLSVNLETYQEINSFKFQNSNKQRATFETAKKYKACNTH